MRRDPIIVLGGSREELAFYDELVAEGVMDLVQHAVRACRRDGRDLFVGVVDGLVTVFDRARLETEPSLPDFMRWLRAAPRGSWLMAMRADGRGLRMRIRWMPMAQGGVA